MPEPLAAFVARRRPEWTRLEALLDRAEQGPLPLNDLQALDTAYRSLTSDLALSQGHWPGTDVQRFVNQLAVRARAFIERPPPIRAGALRRFYAGPFPLAVQQARGAIALAAALLALGTVLGALSVALDPDTERSLVDANLRDFILHEQVWTDVALEGTAPTSMAVQIFLNNLRVMFTAFALGLTAGLGTALVLLFNGVQIGATVGACFRGHVGWRLLEFMSAHGPVELSLIVLAGGAGLHLGRALIDPGERSRARTVRAHAQTSIELVIGAAPFMVAIGIVEGFVSPGPTFPWPLKLAVGALSCFAFWRWVLFRRAS